MDRKWVVEKCIEILLSRAGNANALIRNMDEKNKFRSHAIADMLDSADGTFDRAPLEYKWIKWIQNEWSKNILRCCILYRDDISRL